MEAENDSLDEAIDSLGVTALQIKAERDALLTENKRLREALEGVANTSFTDGSFCFCRHPTQRADQYHEPECGQARAALKGEK